MNALAMHGPAVLVFAIALLVGLGVLASEAEHLRQNYQRRMARARFLDEIGPLPIELQQLRYSRRPSPPADGECR